MSECLSAAVIDALARDEAVGEHATSHVAGCTACTAKLADARAGKARRAKRPSSLAEQFGAEPRVDVTEKQTDPDATERLGTKRSRIELVPVSPGERLGRYMVIEQLGRGGMAVVYRAFDPELDRSVAMKVMFPADGSLHDAAVRSRFIREAQAMARVSHPNVIEVYDVGTVGERAYITMKLVDGGNLRDWVRTKRTWREIVAVYIKAGRGLAAAHAAGLVHRDFKPSNILISKDGAVFVTDFGLARLASSDDDEPAGHVGRSPVSMLSSDITRAGVLAGTEGYIAPELYEGKEPDARSDQFGFCVALYSALFGQPPFARREKSDSTTGTPNPAFKRVPEPADSDVPAWVRRIVQRGLSSDQAQRWRSMDDLLDALEHDPNVARRRWILGGGGVLAAAGAVALLVATRSGSREDLCKGASRHLIGVWDDTARGAGKAAFDKTAVPYAAEAWTSTAAILDRYATTWTETHTDTCRASRVRGEQSDEVMSLRMICLDRRLQELASLTSQLAKADAKTVEKSAQAASALTNIAVCNNVVSLKEVVPEPTDRAAKQKLGEAHQLLADVKALRDSGKFQDALPLATKATLIADQLAFAPLQGESYLAIGKVHADMGNGNDARAALFSALAAAERGHDDRDRAEAEIWFVWIEGFVGEKYELGEQWARTAAATLERQGGDRDLEMVLLNHRAAMLFEQNKYDELLVAQQKLLALREQFNGPTDPQTITALMNLGSVFSLSGDYTKALATYRSAAQRFERLMGPKYFRIGLAYNNIAELMTFQGKAVEALPLARKGYDLIATQRSPTHRDAVAIAFTVAHAMLESGDVTGSIAFMEQHLDEWRKAIGADSDLMADGMNLYAMALRRAGNAAKAATALEAEIANRGKPGVTSTMIPTISTQLAECYLDLHRGTEALTVLEKALTAMTGKAQPLAIADAKFALARALVDTNGELARAKKLATEAQATYRFAGVARSERAGQLLASLSTR